MSVKQSGAPTMQERREKPLINYSQAKNGKMSKMESICLHADLLAKTPITKMNTLYGARNSIDYAKKSKNFTGGRIILKIKDRENLISLKVDDLKKP